MSKFNVGDVVIANGRGHRPKGTVGTVLDNVEGTLKLELADGTRTDSSEYAYDLHYTATEAPIFMNNIEAAIVENQSMAGPETALSDAENSGGSCDYYSVRIHYPTSATMSYVAECNDVIEALNMTYAEANMFKEIWRSAAARTLGKLKAGHDEIRGAEKIEFFAKRNMIQKSR